MGRITELVRELRKNETPFEKELWHYLRRKQLGVKFLRQQPVIYQTWPTQEFFVADFLCYEKKLIIELDGKIHDFQKHYDENRDAIMNELGFKSLRFKNEVLQSMDRILVLIKGEIERR
ncbi:MAG: DUF559 domain-containing protein [Bacteroidia bacterium]